MPLFNYICEDCGKEFEELVRSADEKVPCPKCSSEKVKRQLPNRICANMHSSGGAGSHGFS